MFLNTIHISTSTKVFFNKKLQYGIVLFLIIVNFYCNPLSSFAQKTNFYCNWHWIDIDSIERLPNTKSIKDSTTLHLFLQEIQIKYFEKGYVAFSIDSIYQNVDTAIIYAYHGNQYLVKDIVLQGDYHDFVNSRDLKSVKYYGERQMETLKNKILSNATNQGYPFSTVDIKSYFSGLENTDVTLEVLVEKGTLIYFSKVVINEDSPVSLNYIKKYLGIKKDGLFKADIIENAYRRLDELPFITVNDSSLLYFEDNQAVLDFKLIGQNASNFDLLLGLQPSDDISTGTRKFVMTGNANVNLHNQLKKGEFFGLKYRSPGKTSQELKLQLIYPYILNMPFGVEGKFELFKRDSSFTEVKYDVGLNYIFKGVNSIKVFVQNEKSNLLNINTSQIISSNSLPANLDYSFTLYGIGLHLENLDYRYNPRSGWFVDLTLGIGQRKILKNPIILNLQSTDFDPEQLYSTIKLDITKVNSIVHLEYYFPIGRAGTFLIRNRTAIQIADFLNSENSSNFIQNELYRIGGIYTLRGFDEDTYFAQSYSIFTAEGRLITGRNSNFFAFADYGFLNTTNSDKMLEAYGVGVGLNAETKVGIFSIAYALGNTSDQGINFRNGKIHFGYQAIF